MFGAMMHGLNRVLVEDDGADVIEYAFMVGLIAFGCYLAMTTFTTSFSAFWSSAATKLSTILP